MLISSFAGMGISMLVMGIFFTFVPQYQAIVSVIGTLSYMLTFGLGVGPVPALLVPEISPDKIRGNQQILHINSIIIFFKKKEINIKLITLLQICNILYLNYEIVIKC